MRHRLVRVLLAVAMLVSGSLAASALAQGLTGQISGTVTDSGGGVMPGATVTVKNAGTNQTREAVTGADGAFVFPDLLAGTYDITVDVAGLQDLRAEGHRARRDRAPRRCARSRSRSAAAARRSPSQAEAALVQTTNAARSALITASKIDDIALKGRDFAGNLKLLPGVVDTSAREAPGWGSMGGLSINGRSGVQLLLRRRHQQGHRLELRQLRGAGARLDRRSPGPDVELPGRVRPQLRRDDHRRHPQRLEGLPRQRRLLQARRGAERQRVHRAGSSAARA